MRPFLIFLSVLSVIVLSRPDKKRLKKKLKLSLGEDEDPMSELYFDHPLVDVGGYQAAGGGQQGYGGGAGGGTSAPGTMAPGTAQTAAPSSGTPTISLGAGGFLSPTTNTPTSGAGTVPGTAGTVAPASSTTPAPSACWLQAYGQWIWNTNVVDHEGMLRCGGWVRLPNCKWHWTEQPHNFYPVTCYDIHWQDSSGGSGGNDGHDDGDDDSGSGGDDEGEDDDSGSGGDDEDENDDGGDEDEGPATTAPDEDEGGSGISSGGDGGSGDGGSGDGGSGDGGSGDGGSGDGGSSDGGSGDGGSGGSGSGGDGSGCSCTEWDFPGDCGTDGMIFRWRTCQPRYCDLEDEYVPCEER